MGRLRLALILTASAVTSCGKEGFDNRADAVEEDRVVRVDADDPEMNAAIQSARATLPEFLRRLQSPPKSQEAVSLKVRLTEGDQVEHVWLSDVQLDGTDFVGRIANDVVYLSHRSIGDQVRVNQDDISDWMAIDNGRLVGGTTIRLLRNRMPSSEQAKFDEGIGCVIE